MSCSNGSCTTEPVRVAESLTVDELFDLYGPYCPVMLPSGWTVELDRIGAGGSLGFFKGADRRRLNLADLGDELPGSSQVTTLLDYAQPIDRDGLPQQAGAGYGCLLPRRDIPKRGVTW